MELTPLEYHTLLNLIDQKLEHLEKRLNNPTLNSKVKHRFAAYKEMYLALYSKIENQEE